MCMFSENDYTVKIYNGQNFLYFLLVCFYDTSWILFDVCDGLTVLCKKKKISGLPFTS